MAQHNLRPPRTQWPGLAHEHLLQFSMWSEDPERNYICKKVYQRIVELKASAKAAQAKLKAFYDEDPCLGCETQYIKHADWWLHKRALRYLHQSTPTVFQLPALSLNVQRRNAIFFVPAHPFSTSSIVFQQLKFQHISAMCKEENWHSKTWDSIQWMLVNQLSIVFFGWTSRETPSNSV